MTSAPAGHGSISSLSCIEGWFDAATGEPSRAGTAPLETVFVVRDVPVETAAVVRAAIDRMVQDGVVPADEPWRALEVLAGLVV
ncbi:hypothetical protein AB0D11_47150 [Streptomyces monashensis]|uniref:hypothetical protein n=1 Tax=Streptomyces monashensis TaxID=1678012 RepID=UPI0033ED1535